MKHALSTIALLFFLSLCNAQSIQLSMGQEFNGWYNVYGTGIYDNYHTSYHYDQAYCTEIEFLVNAKPFSIGLGAEYQNPRRVYKTVSYNSLAHNKLHFVPVYLVCRYQMPITKSLTHELFAHGGFNYFVPDTSYLDDEYDTGNGLYWAVGSAYIYKGIVAQLMYKENRAHYHYTYSSENYKFNIKQAQANFTLGYRFNLGKK
jgi:hypothetical protein